MPSGGHISGTRISLRCSRITPAPKISRARRIRKHRKERLWAPLRGPLPVVCVGWLAGIGALAIPGIGPFIAAGPVMAALAGAGALGACGGIVGALVGLGIPEYEAKRYEGRVKHGGILLSIHCDDHDWVKRGEEILKQTGAEDVSSTSEAHADFATSDKPTLRTSSPITLKPTLIAEDFHDTAEPDTAEMDRDAATRRGGKGAAVSATSTYKTPDPPVTSLSQLE